MSGLLACNGRVLVNGIEVGCQLKLCHKGLHEFCFPARTWTSPPKFCSAVAQVATVLDGGRESRCLLYDGHLRTHLFLYQ